MEQLRPFLGSASVAKVVMALEDQINVNGGIDERATRIALENSAALKVDQSGLH